MSSGEAILLDMENKKLQDDLKEANNRIIHLESQIKQHQDVFIELDNRIIALAPIITNKHALLLLDEICSIINPYV